MQASIYKCEILADVSSEIQFPAFPLDFKLSNAPSDFSLAGKRCDADFALSVIQALEKMWQP